MRFKALNPSFFSDMAVKNDTLRAFCCDSLFQMKSRTVKMRGKTHRQSPQTLPMA
jgi:hypothetical protein